MKKYAFTLAEVLITLGIIGIVAAITIPTLMQKKFEQETATKLKKAYSVLANAFTLAVQENGTPDAWNLIDVASQDGAVNMINALAKYLKIVKNCGKGSGCFPNVTYKFLNGNPAYGWNVETDSVGQFAKAQLADGSLMVAYVSDPTCKDPRGNSLNLQSVCGLIGVDINGFNSPNQLGGDLFFFWLTKYGIVPFGSANEYSYQNSFAGTCKDKTSAQAGFGCTAWVLYNENLDYLHCNNLDWNGPTKCP